MTKKYKDSGIEWIGSIPREWETERTKALFSERNERDCKGKTLLSVSQYFGIRPKSETDLADSHIAESYDDYKEVHKGDFVMNIMLAWNGSYAVSDYDGIVSPAYCVFKFRKDCCKKYFHYLLRTDGYPSAFKTMSRGVIDSRLRLYPEQFYTFPIVIPPFDEQQRIADYLDKKCSDIDALVDLQEQMIAQLTDYKQSVITEAVTKGLNSDAELIPSGVDWIGDVPKGWKLTRIKYYGSIRSGEGISIEELKDEGTYPVWGGNGLMGFTNNYNESNTSIIIGRVGALCGNVRLLTAPTFVTDNALIFRLNKSINARFMMWLLTGANLNRLNTSNAQPLITGTKVKNVYFTLPPYSEQQAIASYLDTKCSEIDSLITLKRQKIETLKEYKKSVIYEAVTGKTIID